MSDLIEEIKEDIRGEQYRNFLKRYGFKAFLILATFLILAGVWLWWNNYQTNKLYRDAANYHLAIRNFGKGEFEKGKNIMEKLAYKDTAYSALAGLNLAVFSEFESKFNKSSSLYKSISSNDKQDKILREIARIMHIKSSLAKDTDKKNLDQNIATLNEYIDSEDPVFKYTALEILGVLHLENKNYVSAKTAFSDILTAPNAPDHIRRRANTLMILTSQ